MVTQASLHLASAMRRLLAEWASATRWPLRVVEALRRTRTRVVVFPLTHGAVRFFEAAQNALAVALS